MTTPTYDVAIVGAGIVGSTLASFLAPHARVALIDRSVRGLHGSTGHAPGFVGEFNNVAPLTDLASRSMKYYRTIDGGFANVGGLEVARTPAESALLEARAQGAQAAGIKCEQVSGTYAAKLAPAIVRQGNHAALHFPGDGTADAKVITRTAQDVAEKAGTVLLDADVTAINKTASGYTLTTSTGEVTAAHVAVCTGVWAGQLLPSLAAAAVSVSHPYLYSAVRPQRANTSPFVRYPKAHVYARDHGVRDGLGTYDHDPVHVSAAACAKMSSAYGLWQAMFDKPVREALAMLPDETAKGFSPVSPPEPARVDAVAATDVPYAFNGLFTVTPDGMPLVGQLEDSLWCAVGVWVTHAAGSAEVLAAQILAALGKAKQVDRDAALRVAIDPKRFKGRSDADIESAALRLYNDIYNKDVKK